MALTKTLFFNKNIVFFFLIIINVMGILIRKTTVGKVNVLVHQSCFKHKKVERLLIISFFVTESTCYQFDCSIFFN